MAKLTKNKIKRFFIKLIGWALLMPILILCSLLFELIAIIPIFKPEARIILILISTVICFFLANLWIMIIDNFAEKFSDEQAQPRSSENTA